LTIDAQVMETLPGSTLFDSALAAGVRVPTSCRAQGKCRECILEIVEGADLLSERQERERHLPENFRLACLTRVTAAGEMRCRTMRRGEMRIETAGCGMRAVTPDQAPEGACGVAVDIGTTTVVLRLIELASGRTMAATSFENPQRFAGSEVMGRIQYDTDHPGRLLMRTLAGYMNRAIADFGIAPNAIRQMVVVGNATMRDLFFRVNVHSIGQSPYRSRTELDLEQGLRSTTSLTSTGARCLLSSAAEAEVWGAPVISGHVGADAAACMLAVGLAQEKRLTAIMDIGTNTEVILGNRDRILAASCPAGPAFEGGAITFGMPALEGAIEDVAIDEDGAFRLGVIGGGEPVGICGSGLVDLLSELVRTGRMNEMGRFEDGPESIALGGRVCFSEADVNELAQAKGANAAGLRVIAAQYGVALEEIEVFYLAGGFGRHLKAAAARRIGLIPNLPDVRILPVGNAAIEGAAMALLSRARREELEETVRRVEHCRLETHPSFFDFFVEGCQFRPL
jgi:uncharacterized 2Fe-2S/4Fe-4S cluster protein (DUF4445 family)